MRTGSARAFGTLALAGVLVPLAPACSDDGAKRSSRTTARIDVSGYPFRIASGKRFVWMLAAAATAPAGRSTTAFEGVRR